MLSLRSLFLGVALVAVGCASVVQGRWVLRLLFGICLLTCILGIIYRRAARQAFCVGFVVFGLAFSLSTWQLGLVDMRVWIADSAGAPENVKALESRAALYHQSSNRHKLIQQDLAALQRKATTYSRAEVANELIVWFATIFGGLVGPYLYRTRDALPA